MPARVHVPHRIIHHIRKPIIRGGVPRAGHDRIRLREVTNADIVPPGHVVIQANFIRLPLTGETEVRRQAPAGGPLRTEGQIAALCHLGPAGGRPSEKGRCPLPCAGHSFQWHTPQMHIPICITPNQ
jgi:hypothetical protein